MLDPGLKGKVVLVTGANNPYGIGAAVARAFAAQGAKLFVHYFRQGDIALGFSASSSTTYPGILYTGRVPSDPLGAMESPKTVKNGAGSQNGGLSSWGSYSSMAIDPSDDCTFRYTNEYLETTGSFNWNTRIVSFKFNSCQ